VNILDTYLYPTWGYRRNHVLAEHWLHQPCRAILSSSY
jgi:hypothetical protein